MMGEVSPIFWEKSKSPHSPIFREKFEVPPVLSQGGPAHLGCVKMELLSIAWASESEML